MVHQSQATISRTMHLNSIYNGKFTGGIFLYTQIVKKKDVFFVVYEIRKNQMCRESNSEHFSKKLGLLPICHDSPDQSLTEQWDSISMQIVKKRFLFLWCKKSEKLKCVNHLILNTFQKISNLSWLVTLISNRATISSTTDIYVNAVTIVTAAVYSKNSNRRVRLRFTDASATYFTWCNTSAATQQLRQHNINSDNKTIATAVHQYQHNNCDNFTSTTSTQQSRQQSININITTYSHQQQQYNNRDNNTSISAQQSR